MNNIRHALTVSFVTTFALASFAGTAFAARAAVKVECQGNCNAVTLGQACDVVKQGARPDLVSCDDYITPPAGAGFGVGLCAAGQGNCRHVSLTRETLLGAFCADGHGHDAIVTCYYELTP